MNFYVSSPKITKWILSRPKVSGLITLIILLIGLSGIVLQRYKILEENRNREMSNILNIIEQNFNQSLRNCYATSLTMALIINDNGVPENFYSIGKKLKESNPNIDAVQLVPNGVIKYTYPYEPSIINFDVLKNDYIKIEALEAIKKQKMFFAGPLNLKQGGLGIVGRLPVYKKGKFWGFSAIVIKLQTFIKSSGMSSIDTTKYSFQFSKKNPVTNKMSYFFLGNRDFSKKYYQTLKIPEGNWAIYLIAKNKYEIIEGMIPIISLGLILTCLLPFVVYNTIKKRAELQVLVNQQARKIINTETKFKTIFDQAAIGIAHIDSKNNRFIQANNQFCKMFGYNSNEIRKIKLEEICDHSTIKSYNEKLESLKTGKIRRLSLEKKFLHKNGSIVWANVTYSSLSENDKNPNSFISIMEDITARKISEKIILQSQKKLESLINTIDGIVWECDYKNLFFTYVNNKAQEITGYKNDEWLDNDVFWKNLIHPDDQKWVMNYFESKSKTQKRYDFEYRIIAKDKSVIWIRNIVNVIIENNNPVVLKGIMIDITKQKNAERDLSNSFNLVTEQNKRLLNFSYIVSHNLRSHTSNIQSITSLIDLTESEEERNELIDLLQKVSNTLNETIFSLNDVVSTQTDNNLNLENLNLKQNIDKITEVLSEQIFIKKAMIINNVDSELFVKYNPAYLDSILLNFISNAIRYSDSNRKPEIILNNFTDNGKIVLEISDNGIGIDLQKHGGKIFGLYKTFHNNSDAKGIGLFITKNQIENMGGHVTIESEPNIGTKFKIYFA